MKFIKEKKCFDFLCEILFLAGLKEPELAACDLIKCLNRYFMIDKKREMETGKALKNNGIFCNFIREEVIKIYSCYILNKNYEKPYDRKIKELEVVKKYECLNKIKKDFTKKMIEDINLRYKCFGV